MNELVAYYLGDGKKKIDGYALKLCGFDKIKADDLVQDSLLRIMEKDIKHDHTRGQMSTIICLIIHNSFIDNIRRKKENFQKVELNEADKLVSSKIGFDTHLILKQVEKLPKKAKAIMKAYMEGMSLKEIEEYFSVSPITVRTQIFRSRQFLKMNLKKLDLL